MNVPETSVLSKSVSSVSQSSEQSSSPQSQFSSAVYSAFDQLTQGITLPYVFYYIFLLFALAQVVFVSMWPFHTLVWNNNSVVGDIIRYIYMIVCFCSTDLSDESHMITFLIFTALFVIIIILLLFQGIYYSKKRRFIKASLYPTRFFVELVPLVLLLPSAMLTGNLFISLFSDEISKNVNTIFFVFSLIELIAFTVLFYISASLIGVSAYLSMSPLAAFDIQPCILLFLVNPYFALIGGVFSQYPAWLLYLVIAVHIIFMGYLISLFSCRPFVPITTNAIFLGICYFSIISDLMTVVGNIVKKPNSLVAMIVFFVLLVVCMIVSNLQYYFIERRIKKELSFNEDDEISEEDKLQLFLKYGLEKRQWKAILYLNYSISTHNEKLLDLCFVKFIMQYHRTPKAAVHCTRIVAFFPQMSRLLNICFNETSRKRGLSFQQRFLMFQISKIKLLRQSSSSCIAMERLRDLKQQSNEIANVTQNYYYRKKADIGFLNNLNKSISKTKALWDEALHDFPNNVTYAEECCSFLIECAADFTGAIKQKHRADLIESGKNFIVDLCFRQFVQYFPDYLKMGILDVKGAFVKRMKANKGSSSLSSGSNPNANAASTTTSSMSELDAAIEEGIGKGIINHAKIRLALQHSTMNKKASTNGLMNFINVLLFVVGIAIFLFNTLYFKSFFFKRGANTKRVEYLNQIQLNLDSSVLSLLNYWGESTNSIDYTDFHQAGKLNDDHVTTEFFNSKMTYRNLTAYFASKVRTNFDTLTKDVSELAGSGIDVYKNLKYLFESTSQVQYCNDLEPIYQYNETMKTALTFMAVNLLGLPTNADIPNWFFNNYMLCDILGTAKNLINSFVGTRNLLTQMGTDKTNSVASYLVIMKYAIPIIYGVLCLSLTILASAMYSYEISFFANLLLKLPNEVKREASRSLSKEDNSLINHEVTNHESGVVDHLSSISLPALYCFLCCVFYIIVCVILYIQYDFLEKGNLEQEHLNYWTADSRIRKTYVTEITLWTMQYIFLDNPLIQGTKYLKGDEIFATLNVGFKQLDAATTRLLIDQEGFPTSIGIDPIIDDLTLKEVCVPTKENSSFHDMYRCGSLQNLITFFLNSITVILSNKDSFQGTIKEELNSQIMHLISVHLIPTLNNVDLRFGAYAQGILDDYEVSHTLFLIFEIIASILALAVMFWFNSYLNQCYSIVLVLLRRVSPISIVNNPELMNYLLDKKEGTNSNEMTIDQGIMHNSGDSILCLGVSSVIEILNPAVQKTFGYTPEQLLGQPLYTLIHENSKQQIEQQLGLMRNKQSALTYEGHTICVSDDDSTIPCAITILGMTDNENVNSFVVIIRDETLLQHQQKEAEIAKKQSETLLYQILPQDIVIRLNRGEKDISFTVPSSTIMFIDIVKFSEYATSLTPQEIMGNLSLIFAGFDESINRYPLIIKIKLIGDVYMCAAGLFNPDEPPIGHAEQMVRFGLDCLSNLDDANVKLNAVLNVRIGVNTGGPLIAGVLGTDKPTFDIIGDPINIASRLQSTDPPGMIQISQNTFDLINALDFQIESRGEVYLKGKGKTQAYIVTPIKILNFQGGSADAQSGMASGNDMAEP